MSLPTTDARAAHPATARAAVRALTEGQTLALLRVAACAALVWILLPFYAALLWAGVIALLFAPVQRRLVQRGHLRPSLAAALTTALVLLVLVLPLAAATAALAREAATLVQALQSGTVEPGRYLRGLFDALPAWLTQALARLGLVDFDELQRRATLALAQGGQYLAGQAFSLGQNMFEFMAAAGITLYLSFFLLRDGSSLAVAARRAVPLDEVHQQALFEKFATVIRAVVRGNLLVAAVQGALGGLAFAWLGVPGALLWAVLMAFLSLVPAVGAALVWVPVAGYHLAIGQWGDALALAAWGVLVIGLADNLLRPLLVGHDTRMPDYVVLTSTLGGMAVFGINGFVLGPAIAAMFIAIWHLEVAPAVTAAPDRPPSV